MDTPAYYRGERLEDARNPLKTRAAATRRVKARREQGRGLRHAVIRPSSLFQNFSFETAALKNRSFVEPWVRRLKSIIRETVSKGGEIIPD
jgi:hypothetical protein